MQWVIFMQELNALAARVWKRVAAGEAYISKSNVKPTPKPQSVNPLYLLLLVAVLKNLELHCNS